MDGGLNCFAKNEGKKRRGRRKGRPKFGRGKGRGKREKMKKEGQTKRMKLFSSFFFCSKKQLIIMIKI